MSLLRTATLGAVAVLIPLIAHAQPHSAVTPVTSTTPRQVGDLPHLRQALRTRHTARILAIGSSSTAGVGASSPSKTYVARLETDLETALSGTHFQVIAHGLSGEVAEGAAARMKREVEEAKPDLVIWQVGTNDALQHVAIAGFRQCMRRTLVWLNEQKIDVLLINPQYSDTLAKDPLYAEVVATIDGVARELQVPVVDRFATMQLLQHQRGGHFDLSSDNLHMNDEGYRHLAAHAAATIVNLLAPAETATAR